MNISKHIEKIIIVCLNEFNQAFQAHDIDRAMSLFAADEQVTFIGSEIIEEAFNREQLQALLERIFARPATYSWEWKRRDISAVGDIAWAMVDAVIHSRYENGEEESGPYRISGVFKREGDRWYWVQFHGSEPVPVDE